MICNYLSNMGGVSKKVFFCGIGGVSMSGLAIMLKSLGYSVSGSDCAPRQEIIDLCRENKIPLFFSHSEENVKGCELVVYSSAIASDNCEIVAAKHLGIPLIKRSALLGALTSGFRQSVAIAGTHGKSTVTAMIYTALDCLGLSPNLLCGAALRKNGLSFAFGNDDIIIYEACEYDRSFLDLKPKISIILNIELEHTDTYPTLADAEEAYFKFAASSDTVILNYNNSSCLALGKRLIAMGKTVRFFSLDPTEGALFCKNVTEKNGFYSFDVGGNDAKVNLKIAGKHNVENALAALSACSALGVRDLKQTALGISSFIGLKRRFEYIGSYNGADIYDDYAHHPTEIKATLSTARKLGYNKITVAFQGHTYSRTKAFLQEFADALCDADEVIIAPIYAAREKNDGFCYEELLASKLKNGKYVRSGSEILRHLALSSHPQSMILTMGAGQLNEIAYSLANMEK